MWEFATTIPRERRERLLSHRGFESVVGRFILEARVIGFAWEPFHGERLIGCNRAAFLLSVSEETYDAFFNAPAGYRGQFAKSPQTGEIANRLLLSNVEPLLLANPFTEQRALGPLVSKSLRATDAKCWIYEREVEDHMGVDAPEILYAPWQNASDNGAGLRAPLGTRIEVKGGWIDPLGVEHRDPSKLSRSTEIHEVGYS